MTVAEKIKRNTKPLTLNRALEARANSVTRKLLLPWGLGATAYAYVFIDGSKLTCRVYW